MTTETPSSSPTPPEPAAPAADPGPNMREVTLEYRRPHSVPSGAEYPSEDALRAKTDEAISPGFWRVYIYKRQPKDLTLNVITLKGIALPNDIPSNLEPEELDRAILSVCYRNLRESGERSHYLVRFKFKQTSGVRPKQGQVSFTLDPLDNDQNTYDDGSIPDHPDLKEEQRDQRFRTGPWADPEPSSFQRTFSPFSEQAREHRRSMWRDDFLRAAEDGHTDQDSHERKFEEDLASRRSQLFSPDMMLPPQMERGSSGSDRSYTEATLPYVLINSSMGMSYKAFAAAFDMLTSASREQARIHALQMQVTIDREKELMKLPLKFMEIEANNKGHHSEILNQSQKNYLDALRMRGDMAQRELGFERQNMQAQYQIADTQRQLQEQDEKHHTEQGETFRRDLLRGIGPMALQGLGLFLEYFGQQKLGAAAKMSGTMVDGLMQQAEGARSSGPDSPPSPSPRPAPAPPSPGTPSGPRGGSPGHVGTEARGPETVIPRRHLRILDVATQEEIQTLPLRSICRMADRALSREDRQRAQELLGSSWDQLEDALRATDDLQCMSKLGTAMYAFSQDRGPFDQLMSTLSPGQRGLFDKIGEVMQGQPVGIDYVIEIHPVAPPVRPVATTQRVHRAPPPVPPSAPGVQSSAPPRKGEVADLNVPVEPTTEPSQEASGEDVDDDPPRPTLESVRADDAPDVSLGQIADELREVGDELLKIRAERDAAQAELEQATEAIRVAQDKQSAAKPPRRRAKKTSTKKPARKQAKKKGR